MNNTSTMSGGLVYSSGIYSHQGRQWLLSRRQNLASAQDDLRYYSYNSSCIKQNESSEIGKLVASATKLSRIKKGLFNTNSTKKIISHHFLEMLSDYIRTGNEVVVKQPQKTLLDIDIGDYRTILEDLNISGKKFPSNSLDNFEKIVLETPDKIIYTPMLNPKQVATLISLSSALAQGQRDERKQIEALFDAKSLLDSNCRVTSHVTAPVIAWHMADHKVSCNMCGLKFSTTKYKTMHHEAYHQKVKKSSSNWLPLNIWIEKSAEIYTEKSYSSSQITLNTLHELWSNQTPFKWIGKTLQFDESLDVFMEDHQELGVDLATDSQKCDPLEMLNAWSLGDKSLANHSIIDSTNIPSLSHPCNTAVCDFSNHLCVVCGDSLNILYSERLGTFVVENAIPLLQMTPLHVKKDRVPNPHLSCRLWKKFGLNLYGDYWSYINSIPSDVTYAHYQCFNFMSIYNASRDDVLNDSGASNLTGQFKMAFEKIEEDAKKRRKIDIQDIKTPQH